MPSPPPSPTPSAPAAVLPVAPAPPASPPAIVETPLQGLVAPAVTLAPQSISGDVVLAGLVTAASLLLLLSADRLVGWNRRSPRL
ncbi:MAG: hypothetical protein ACLQGJ_03080 [Candidatus Dormibacteria bacterium]